MFEGLLSNETLPMSWSGKVGYPPAQLRPSLSSSYSSIDRTQSDPQSDFEPAEIAESRVARAQDYPEYSSESDTPHNDQIAAHILTDLPLENEHGHETPPASSPLRPSAHLFSSPNAMSPFSFVKQTPNSSTHTPIIPSKWHLPDIEAPSSPLKLFRAQQGNDW
jgi:hypothetical protein